jgi:hypothetical protein
LKIITFAWNGNGNSNKAYTYNQFPKIMTGNNKEIKNMFILIRNFLKKDWNNFLNKNLACTKEFSYKFKISIANVEKDKVYFKTFEINPKNLKR